jgi:L-ascorbate metabolism protein UlaG (beta-lactamase superfamily)
MTHCLPVLPLVLISTALSALTTNTLAAQSPRLTVEYLANEGVLISHGETQIIVDALFGDGLPEYPTVPTAVRDSLERALGRFGAIDLVLVTHRHDDHFNPATVARHLRSNPGARLVAAPEVVRVVRNQADSGVWARMISMPPDPATPSQWVGNGVTIEGHAISHARVEHLVWVIEIAGKRLLHAGDAEPSLADLRRAAGSGIDLLLTPWWLASGRQGPERIEATQARQVAAFHIGRSDQFRTVLGVVALRSPGQVLTVP